MDSNKETRRKNKRIFKNTLYMYARMIVMLIISLFTARIVFNTLGVEDYGTYNVVGSIIVFFSFINGGLGAASSRYITAEIGKGTEQSGRKVFNVCLQAHAVIAIIVFLLGETVGLWLVNSALNLPEGRYFAANIVYQFSIITAVINILYSPFNTTLLAYERMNIYAYLTIFDAINRLLIIFLIQHLEGDKLIIYGILTFVASIIIASFNYGYCFKHFAICHPKLYKDVALLKEIFKFTSWSLLGQACIVGTNQGVTFLINIFCGVVVNAAMGISNQITNIVSNFVRNFQMAFQPQIVKSYSTKDYAYLKSLIYRSSKITSMLILVFSVPICVEIGNVLQIWLGDYPQYACEFCQWTLVALFFDNITGPLWMTINSQSNIKKYQIVTSLIFSMNFFMGWFVLFLGWFPPYSVMIVRVFVFVALIFVRLSFTKKFFNEFMIFRWLKEVLLTSVLIFVVSYGLCRLVIEYLDMSLWTELISMSVLSELILIPLCLYAMFEKTERNKFYSILRKKISLKK